MKLPTTAQEMRDRAKQVLESKLSEQKKAENEATRRFLEWKKGPMMNLIAQDYENIMQALSKAIQKDPTTTKIKYWLSEDRFDNPSKISGFDCACEELTTQLVKAGFTVTIGKCRTIDDSKMYETEYWPIHRKRFDVSF